VDKGPQRGPSSPRVPRPGRSVKERKENSCPVIPLLTMHSYERNLLTNGGRIGLSVSISLPTSGKSSN
jgi:hypothetical protein